MTVVENCIVWRTLKAFNLKQREKLLAAICMTFQETVEGNSHRSTVGCPQDFVDWGRCWETDEMEAQVVLQNQLDNILHHIMGIAAAMEVWKPDAGASSSSQGGKITQGQNLRALPALMNWMKTMERPSPQTNNLKRGIIQQKVKQKEETTPPNEFQERGRPIISRICSGSTAERHCHHYEAECFMQLG